MGIGGGVGVLVCTLVVASPERSVERSQIQESRVENLEVWPLGRYGEVAVEVESGSDGERARAQRWRGAGLGARRGYRGRSMNFHKASKCLLFVVSCGHTSKEKR